MKSYILQIKDKIRAYTSDIGCSLLDFIISFDSVKSAIAFYKKNLADLNRGWNYIAIISIFFKLISSIVLFIFFDYEEENIRQLIGQLGLFFLLFGFVYYYYRDLVEFYVNKFIVKLLSMQFLVNYLMFYVFYGILCDRYHPYLGLKGTGTEGVTRYDKLGTSFNASLIVYFFPFVLLSLTMMVSLPYFFVLAYTFLLLLSKSIIRGIDFAQPETIFNLEVIRLVMTDEKSAQELLFKTNKFLSLSPDIQNLYKFLYNASRKYSADLKSNSLGWFVTFIFLVSLFFRYGVNSLEKIYSLNIINKFKRLSYDYEQSLGEIKKINKNLFDTFPKMDQTIILSAGPFVNWGSFRRAASSAAGAGTVGYAFFKAKNRMEIDAAKEIQNHIEESNRNINKNNEESNRNIAKIIVDANKNDYKNQTQNSLELADQLAKRGFTNDQIVGMIPVPKYNNLIIPNKNHEAIKVMNSVRDDFKPKSVLENNENTKSIWLVIKELISDIFF